MKKSKPTASGPKRTPRFVGEDDVVTPSGNSGPSASSPTTSTSQQSTNSFFPQVAPNSSGTYAAAASRGSFAPNFLKNVTKRDDRATGKSAGEDPDENYFKSGLGRGLDEEDSDEESGGGRSGLQQQQQKRRQSPSGVILEGNQNGPSATKIAPNSSSTLHHRRTLPPLQATVQISAAPTHHQQQHHSKVIDGVVRTASSTPPASQPASPTSPSSHYHTNEEDHAQRIEWQTFLSSVLLGEVLRSEKTRIGEEVAPPDVMKGTFGRSLWWGVRAKVRGRGEVEEKMRVEEKRGRVVDGILDEVMNFACTPSATSTAFDQVVQVLTRLQHAESLYPHTQAFKEAKPLYASDEFQSRVKALVSWSNVVLSLRTQRGILQKWTGSKELDVRGAGTTEEPILPPVKKADGEDDTQRIESPEPVDEVEDRESFEGGAEDHQKDGGRLPKEGVQLPRLRQIKQQQQKQQLRQASTASGNEDPEKPTRPPTFVERVMREDSLSKTFERKIVRDLYHLISTSKSVFLQHLHLFIALNLPPYENELLLLIQFPLHLMEESLRVRLAYAAGVKDPGVIVIDQLSEDFRGAIQLACTIKRQYDDIMRPPDGDGRDKWNLPSCIEDTYDQMLIDALRFYFKLLHWRLKSGKAIYFRETDVLEAEWDFLTSSAEVIRGGDLIVAEQFCSLTKKLMVRVINYFETQLHVPSSKIMKATLDQPAASYKLAASSSARKKFSSQPLRDPHQEPEDQQQQQQNHLMQHTVGHSGNVVVDMQMNEEERVAWFAKILEAVRIRYRKLQRFARRLESRFDNSADYNLMNTDLELVLKSLYDSGHFLVYTGGWEAHSCYIVADPSLRDRPELIRDIISKAFRPIPNLAKDNDEEVGGGGATNNAFANHPLEKDIFGAAVEKDESVKITSDEKVSRVDDLDELSGSAKDLASYLLILSPTLQFIWPGPMLHLPIPFINLDMKDDRIRLIAAGPEGQFIAAKESFKESLFDYDTGEVIPLECLVEKQAHRPSVQRELYRISKAAVRLSEAIVESVTHVRSSLQGHKSSQELVENWFVFSSQHGEQAEKHMDEFYRPVFVQMLMHLAINWVTFITEDCDPTAHKTFRWTVNALEFARTATNGDNILQLEEEDFIWLQERISNCIALLISHFDILGARSSHAAIKDEEMKREMRRLQAGLQDFNHQDEESDSRSNSPDNLRRLTAEYIGSSITDRSIRLTHESRQKLIQSLESSRIQKDWDMHIVGRVVNSDRPEDRSLVALAASSSNVSIHWQQGRFIGAGAYGKVYTAHNMDQNTVMAVKEIRFSDVSNLPSVYKQIRDESTVMQMLSHKNIVEYYGIEVHRDKVYIFQEYCDGGSLKDLLEHGRIEQEVVIMDYTCQILSGLKYLHEQGIVHRDIKPDNVLLTGDASIIKLVDFGAAKIIARGHRTINRTRGGVGDRAPAGTQMNSLQGTPMYMSPEVIKNMPGGRLGAMDIWSVGCMVLEFATGKKPWATAENEWAILYKIGAGEIPPLPEEDQLTLGGIDFIMECLTVDPDQRPTAAELLEHQYWIRFYMDYVEGQEALEQEMAEMEPELIQDDVNTPYSNGSSFSSMGDETGAVDYIGTYDGNVAADDSQENLSSTVSPFESYNDFTDPSFAK